MKGRVGVFALAAASVVTVLLAAWLPARLFGSGIVSTVYDPVAGELTRSEKAELCKQYISQRLDSRHIGYSSYAELEQQGYRELLARIHALNQRLRDELTVEPDIRNITEEGANYLLLIDESGRTFPVFHYYVGWDGNWHNWFHTAYDIETGEVLFFYSSAEYRKGDRLNLHSLPADPKAAAGVWSGYTGLYLFSVSWDGNFEHAASANYALENVDLGIGDYGADLLYSISCRNITGRMFDCRIEMQPWR